MTQVTVQQAELERISMGNRVAKPPRTRGRDGRWKRADHGEWDWFYALPRDEQVHVRAHYMTDLGVEPDVLADWNGLDVDAAMTLWVGAIRAIRRGALAGDPLDFDEAELEEIYEEIEPSRYVDAMRASPPVVDLVGPSEVAERAGVSRSTITQWRRRHDDFPAPLAVLGAGRRAPRGETGGMPVWEWDEIRSWLMATGRPFG